MRNIFTALLIVLSTALLMAQEEKIYYREGRYTHIRKGRSL